MLFVRTGAEVDVVWSIWSQCIWVRAFVGLFMFRRVSISFLLLLVRHLFMFVRLVDSVSTSRLETLDSDVGRKAAGQKTPSGRWTMSNMTTRPLLLWVDFRGSRQSSQSMPKTSESGHCLLVRRWRNTEVHVLFHRSSLWSVPRLINASLLKALPYIREECQEAPGIPSMDANLVQASEMRDVQKLLGAPGLTTRSKDAPRREVGHILIARPTCECWLPSFQRPISSCQKATSF